jgi:lysyl-tRNA synthetase class 1
LWGFITRYQPDATPARAPMLDRLVRHAIRYYQDFIKPAKRYRAPSDIERAALEDLVGTLEALPKGADADTIQTEVYEVGKRHPFPELKAWFSALYEVLLGQQQGPRFGSFIALYGLGETVKLVREALSRSQKSEDRRQ